MKKKSHLLIIFSHNTLKNPTSISFFFTYIKFQKKFHLHYYLLKLYDYLEFEGLCQFLHDSESVSGLNHNSGFGRTLLKGGHVTSLTLTLLSVVRGLMTFIDIVTIIGAIKRSKNILIFWILFAVINMAVDIFRCITGPEKEAISLGYGYGYETLKRGC